MTTLEAIITITEDKQRERRVPAHALLLEVAAMTGKFPEEVRQDAAKLAEVGEIHIWRTLNSEAYEPVGNSDNIELTETQ